MYYIYILFRANGEPFYVGKGKGDRHKVSSKSSSHRSHKNAVIRKTLEAIGEVPTVIAHYDLDEPTAFVYERTLIAAIGRHPLGPLTNQTDGGEGISGFVQSAETKLKQSIKKIGNKNALGTVHSPERRAKEAACKIGNKHALGFKRSAEMNAKSSAALRAWNQTQEGKAKRREQADKRLGISPSAETRAKISSTLMGRPNACKGIKRPHLVGRKQSAEICAKKSESVKAWLSTPEGKAQILAQAANHRGRKRPKDTCDKMRSAALNRSAEHRANMKIGAQRRAARGRETKLLIQLMMAGREQIVFQHLGI